MNGERDNHEHNNLLMATLGFDAEDLAANRNGYMSKKQRKTLSRYCRIWKFFVVLPLLIMPIAIVLAILDGYRIHDTPSSRLGVCGLISIVASAYSFYAYNNVQKFNKDF